MKFLRVWAACFVFFAVLIGVSMVALVVMEAAWPHVLRAYHAVPWHHPLVASVTVCALASFFFAVFSYNDWG